MRNTEDNTESKLVDKFTQALINVAGTEDGAFVLKSIMDDCGLFSNSFTGNSSSFFNDGRRSVALDIFNRIKDEDPVMAVGLISNKYKFISKPINQ